MMRLRVRCLHVSGKHGCWLRKYARARHARAKHLAAMSSARANTCACDMRARSCDASMYYACTCDARICNARIHALNLYARRYVSCYTRTHCHTMRRRVM
eukprot:6192770-Pleurochrysis_carterae.AAC.1